MDRSKSTTAYTPYVLESQLLNCLNNTIIFTLAQIMTPWFATKLLAKKRRHRGVPWLLELRCSASFVTTVCSVAIFTDTFVYGVVSVALQHQALILADHLLFSSGRACSTIHIDDAREYSGFERLGSSIVSEQF